MLGTVQTCRKCFETDCTSNLQCVLGERFHRAGTLIRPGQGMLEVREPLRLEIRRKRKRNVTRRFAILLRRTVFRPSHATGAAPAKPDPRGHLYNARRAG